MKSFDEVVTAALDVQAFCRLHQWKFCFIGGVAVQRWGTSRYTQDVDLTLLTGFGGELPYINTMLQKYTGRRPDARTIALRHRVLLLRSNLGIDLDVALGALPFEEEAVHRATPWDVGAGNTLWTCSAEDLIVHKVFAGRDRDWGDVESVLARWKGQLNLDQIRRDLSPLLELKDDAASLPKLEMLIASI